MTLSEQGVQFIAGFEGFSAKPYADVVGVWTIGYGSTLYPDGRKVGPIDAYIDEATGLKYLGAHIAKLVEPYINKTFKDATQTQFDALCSFAYNLGVGALDKSSLKHDIMTGNGCGTVASDFAKWNKAGGKVVAGLVRRRAAEAKLYCTGQYT